jgi:hypothetical protein
MITIFKYKYLNYKNNNKKKNHKNMQTATPKISEVKDITRI